MKFRARHPRSLKVVELEYKNQIMAKKHNPCLIDWAIIE
jgi:hypothetical protein